MSGVCVCVCVCVRACVHACVCVCTVNTSSTDRVWDTYETRNCKTTKPTIAELWQEMDTVERKMAVQVNVAARDLGLEPHKTVKLESNSQLGHYLRVTRKVIGGSGILCTHTHTTHTHTQTHKHTHRHKHTHTCAYSSKTCHVTSPLHSDGEEPSGAECLHHPRHTQ